MRTHHRPLLKPLIAAIRAAGMPFTRWATLALMPGLAVAGPLGEQVVQGTVNVTRPNATTTNVNQGSNRAIVNWNSFSVAGNEYVHFIQPGSTSSILNRVVGGQESQILGRIDANGRVFLVNQNGVYFGGGAKVETAGFAASTLDIKDNDFMAGNYVFARQPGSGDGEVSNAGELDASQFVMLIGDTVKNDGIIQAQLGSVVLAAGSRVSLQLDKTGLVNFAVDQATLAQQAGVENTGQILANGGRVLMTAKVAEGLVTTAVNNSGLVQARGIGEENGLIVLRGTGGDVVNSGKIDASGKTGGHVLVASSRDVRIESGAKVLAEGQGSGKGGSVRLVGERNLTVADGALVSTRGGAAGGQGGFIEVSAHQGGMNLADGAIQTGPGGKMLIDPARLLITQTNNSPYGSSGASYVEIGADYIENLLNYGTDVLLVAAVSVDAGVGMTDITATTGSGDLAIKTGTVSGLSAGSFSVGAPFVRNSGGNINLTGVDINIRGGFTAVAGSIDGDVHLGNVTSKDFITIQAGMGSVDTPNGGLVDVGNLNVVDTNNAALITVSGGVITAGNLVAYGGSTADGTRLDAEIRVTSAKSMSLVSAIATGDSASVDLTNNGTGALLVSGNVRAIGGSYGSGSVDIYNNLGTVTVTGEIRATGSSADVYVFGKGNVSLGNVLAIAGNSSASVSISGSANIVAGNITATGTSASVYVDGSGTVTLGNVLVRATSNEAYIDIYATGNLRTGNLTAVNTGDSSASIYVNGQANVTLGNLTATAASSSASIDINAGGNITVGNAIATGTSASVSFYADGDINVTGVVRARGTQNSANVYLTALTGDVRVAGATQAVGYSSAGVYVEGQKVSLLDGVIAKASTSADGSASFSVQANNGITIGGLVDVRGGAGDGNSSSEGFRGYARISLQNGSLSNASDSGAIVVNGPMLARAGYQATLNINNDIGAVVLNGDTAITQTGTNNAGSGFAGAFANVQAPTGIAVNGDFSVTGEAALITVAAVKDISRGVRVGQSSYGGSIGFLPTGPVSINGRMSATATRATPVIPASISLAGTSINITAPVVASQIGILVRGGAITTSGLGLLDADDLLIGVITASKGISIRTNSQRIVLGNGLAGGFSSSASYGSSSVRVGNRFAAATAPASPVDVAIDNSLNKGRTIFYTDPEAYLGSSGSVGISPLALDTAIFKAGGDTVFHDAVRATSLAVDVSGGTLEFLSTVDVGNGALPKIFGDGALIASLKAALVAAGADLNLPAFGGALTTGPNASFAARDGITFSTGVSFNDPDVPYVVFKTDGTLDFGKSLPQPDTGELKGVRSINPNRQDFLAQFKAYTSTRTVHVENSQSSFADGPTFSDEKHFSELPGTTLLFGGVGSVGGISVGPLVDVGHQNAFFVAQGPLTGAGNLSSTGVRGGVGNLRNFDPSAPFPSGAIGGYVVFDDNGFPLTLDLSGNPVAQLLTPDVVNDAGSGIIAGITDEITVDGNQDQLTTTDDQEKKKDKDSETVDVASSDATETKEMVTSKTNTGQMCE